MLRDWTKPLVNVQAVGHVCISHVYPCLEAQPPISSSPFCLNQGLPGFVKNVALVASVEKQKTRYASFLMFLSPMFNFNFSDGWKIGCI